MVKISDINLLINNVSETIIAEKPATSKFSLPKRLPTYSKHDRNVLPNHEVSIFSGHSYRITSD